MLCGWAYGRGKTSAFAGPANDAGSMLYVRIAHRTHADAFVARRRHSHPKPRQHAGSRLHRFPCVCLQHTCIHACMRACFVFFKADDISMVCCSRDQAGGENTFAHCLWEWVGTCWDGMSNLCGGFGALFGGVEEVSGGSNNVAYITRALEVHSPGLHSSRSLALGQRGTPE